jgi:chromosome segregation ATPase
MHDDDAPNFKIRLDDDLEDEGYETAGETAEEKISEDEDEFPERHRKGRRVSKSDRKISLTGIVLAGLAIAVLAGGYFSLKSQIAMNTHAGASAVTSLSLTLEARLASIADAQKELDQKINADIEDISSRIQKIEKSVSAVRTSKSDKAEVEKALTDIEKKLSPIQKMLEDMKSEISDVSESTQKKITGFSESLAAHGTRIDKANTELAGYDSEFSRLNEEISQLKAEKLEKNALAQSLKAENERYMTLINNLNRELGILKLRTKALEEYSTQNSYRSESTGKTPTSEKKGDIIEQPIR